MLLITIVQPLTEIFRSVNTLFSTSNDANAFNANSEFKDMARMVLIGGQREWSK